MNPETAVEPLAISVTGAGKALDCSTRHIINLINTGELESFKSGRRRLVPIDGLKRYIAKKRKES